MSLRATMTRKFGIEPVMRLAVDELLEYLRSNQAVVFAPPSAEDSVDKR